MPLGRILPWLSGTVPMQPACAARAAHPGPPRPRSAQHARPTGWPSSAGVSAHDSAARLRYGGDLTGAREAAEESTAGPHQCVEGGAAELVGVDGGVGRHGEAWTPMSGGTAVRRGHTRMAMERVRAAARHENVAARRTHRRVGWGRRRRRCAQT
jgi:hypothetical protein